MQLPEYLKSGDVARLFPVIAETGKEQRATSILLSVMSAVPAFSDAILSEIGPRIGTRSSVNTFTEVVFKNEATDGNRDRPDGLINISSRGKQWSALLETKIGNNTIEQNQVERYLRLARDNSIDAVITVSNQFAGLPAHHPLVVPKALTRKVSLYHFSWAFILTKAVLIHENSEIRDPEQAFLIRELVRFFSHPSAGVTGFTSMPPEWTKVIQRMQAGAKLQKDATTATIVKDWHQEIRDLSLVMSRVISCNTSVKIRRAHVTDAELRLRQDIDVLRTRERLEATLQIPDAAADLYVVADLRSRSLRVSMTLDAPGDRKTNKARLNWILRQLGEIELEEQISIGINWASRAHNSVFSLAELRLNPDIIATASTKAEIRAFKITLTSSNARRFSGRRTFIEDLEFFAPHFYELIGQHLRAWKAPPPKPKHSVTRAGESTKEAEPQQDRNVEEAPEKPALPGNAHLDLIEIPAFLRRDYDLSSPGDSLPKPTHVGIH